MIFYARSYLKLINFNVYRIYFQYWTIDAIIGSKFLGHIALYLF